MVDCTNERLTSSNYKFECRRNDKGPPKKAFDRYADELSVPAFLCPVRCRSTKAAMALD